MSRTVKHYNSYRSFLTEKFKTPVLKVSLNAGLNCPNRDGTKGEGGCAFCDNRAFSPAALDQLPVLAQLQNAIAKNTARYKAFLAYLQPFSNTYATLDRLKKIYEPLIAFPGVVGLAIGTRPDCFTEALYGYLGDLNRRTSVSVELGLQSAHDATLERIHRGHTVADFINCVERLKRAGVESVAHVILGLPGENREMMLETARFCARQPLSGVKIHQLMVVTGTACGQWYRQGILKPLELAEYAGLVSEFVKYLRPDQYIHRLAADSTPQRGLIAPLWSKDKAGTMRAITEYMDKHAVKQGECFTGPAKAIT